MTENLASERSSFSPADGQRACPTGHASTYSILARHVLERMDAAEKLAKPGAPEYDLYMKSALMNEWPVIKAALLYIVQDHPDETDR